MTCYLVRHGKDDDSVRGGWSSSPLTDVGFAQVNHLAAKISSICKTKIGMIYTSDLLRAKQTADIISAALQVPVEEIPAFREVNNGELAGMDNFLASERYPNLYWNTLQWDQHYPGGESPHEFYDRIHDAWYMFKEKYQSANYDVILVTHGGVIQVIQCIENGIPYSNKQNPYPIGNAEMIGIEINNS